MGGRIKKFKFKIKSWQLLLILVPLVFIDVTLMRQDHITMTELRQAVLDADSEDDDEKIASSLSELREFVSKNMVINVMDENGTQKVMFGTGPFYLEHQYIRAASKALKEAEEKYSSDSNPNGNVYAKAGEICRARALANGWTWDNPNFINCELEEIAKYPSADEIQDKIIASLPSTEMYRHNYASPVWAPSLVGFFVLITIVVIVVIFIRVFIWIFIRISLFFI